MAQPFAAIVHWAGRVFGDDICARVFAPLLADWAYEQRHAGTWWRRSLTASRWTLALVTTALCVAWRHDAPAWRATRTLGLFSAVGTVALIAPFSPHLASGPPHAMRLVGYLVPQAVALALPFAVLPVAMLLGAVATTVSAGFLRRRLRVLVAGIALMTMIDLAWVVPEANQRSATQHAWS